MAIARALATDPAFVLMDEPTGILDAKNSENVLKLVAYLREQTGKTFIIATHDPMVASHADRAIRIIDGQVASIEDSTLTAGDVGVFVGGDLNEVALDHFTVEVPD